MKLYKVGLPFSIAVIVANMIGIGIYTSLGFQVSEIRSVSAILILWLIGGVTSLCGALVYAELALRYPGSGGEYNYLTRIYRPSIGFLSGWVTSVVGFPAPIAIISMALAKYLSVFYPSLNPVAVACGVVIIICIVNLMGLKTTDRVQTSLTFVNIILLLAVIAAGFIFARPSHFIISFTKKDFDYLVTPAAAVSLVYVAYAYTGWNAITYLAGKVKNPSRNIPLSLVTATIAVSIIYLLINLVFMYAVPMEELAGKIEIAQIFAQKILGSTGIRIISCVIGISLFASMNSMMVAGTYVSNQILEDYNFFTSPKFVANSKNQTPVVSILIQTAIALLLIITSTFSSVIIYMGFTLTFFNTLAVIGIFISRTKHKIKTEYKIPLYPVVPIIFILIQSWMLFYVFRDKPIQSLAGIFTIIIGWVIYVLIFRGRK